MADEDKRQRDVKHLGFTIQLGKRNVDIRIEAQKASNILAVIAVVISLLAAISEIIPVLTQLLGGH